MFKDIMLLVSNFFKTRKLLNAVFKSFNTQRLT